MKKGLLLSIVASTMIFAGGDIAPVEPAAAAPAADCSDFYGSVGAYYQTVDAEVETTIGGVTSTVENEGFFDKSSSNFNVTAVIGVEKTLFGGIGFGAEVAGWSRISNDIAMANRTESGKEDGELSQLYLTASFGNTAVKFGRFAIPGSLSPLLRTGTTAGVKGTTYDGLLIANTDLADTTIYGVWAYRAGTHSTFAKIGADETGAFALGFQNKSIANTTITAVGYYGPDLEAMGSDAIAGALTVNSKFGAYGVDAQVTYVDLDLGGDATMTAALKVSGNFDAFDAWAMASYVNDGSYRSTLAGGSGSLLGDAIDHTAGEGFGIGGGLSAQVGMGKLYAAAGYISFEDTVVVDDYAFGTVGYKFKAAGINFKAEYKYSKANLNMVPTTDEASLTQQRIRLEAAYKF